MFSKKEFIKKGLLSAIGKLAEYQIILYSVDWHDKGVLDENDLAEINGALEAYKLSLHQPKNTQTEETPESEPETGSEVESESEEVVTESEVTEDA